MPIGLFSARATVPQRVGNRFGDHLVGSVVVRKLLGRVVDRLAVEGFMDLLEIGNARRLRQRALHDFSDVPR